MIVLSRILFVVFLVHGSVGLGQEGDYDFEVNDSDLEVNSFGDNSNNVPGDFPASKSNSENFDDYGGISNFADDELDFENSDEGKLNFGNEDEEGTQLDEESSPKKKNKPKVRATKKASKSSPAEPAIEPASNTDFAPLNANEVPNNVELNPEAVVDESPYAPLPDDTMAPPAAEILPANEFGGAPAIPGTRRIMALGEAPESYRVRAGDTLFDVCDQLLDESQYWPKLWALNPSIKNPHFIYPGMTLRFYPGDDEIPPYLQVVREEDIVPVEKGNISEADLITEEMADVLFDTFIPSVGSVAFVEEDSVESFDIEEVGSVSKGDVVGVVVPAFYFAEEPEVLAEVVGSREGWGLSHDGEYFIVENESGVSPGSVYSVVRPVEILDIPEFDGDVGYRYEFVASARITRSLDDDMSEAKVVYTRLGARPGDLLIKYQSVKRSVAVNSNNVTGGGNGTVIGFSNSYQQIGAEGSLVFLSGNFSAGSVVPVFNDTSLLNLNRFASDFPEVVRPVGKIRIIESGTQASLGYIVNSIRFIRIGDFTGQG